MLPIVASAWVSALAAIATLVITNTLQSGPLKILERTDISIDKFHDFEGLSTLKSKSEFTQLYLRCSAPTVEDISGSFYEGFLLPLGVCSPISSFISHKLFGPGRWTGKFFDRTSGSNIFTKFGSPNTLQMSKMFDMEYVKSELDGGLSIGLDYSRHNKFHLIAWGMRDELRKLDDNCNIILGCGGLAFSGGVRNFAPFVLIRSKKTKPGTP